MVRPSLTVDQLRETKASAATQGALISVFPESRQKVVTGMDNLYQGMDPQKALDQVAKETDLALEIANKKKGNYYNLFGIRILKV